jgi:hypothetical protein
MPIKTRKVTPRMAEANRKDAQKSTGPRTPQGKQQVAYFPSPTRAGEGFPQGGTG